MLTFKPCCPRFFKGEHKDGNKSMIMIQPFKNLPGIVG